MVLLTVAGFDPSGGAGALLDAAVFRAFGFRGTAALTAVTAQDAKSVFRVEPLPARLVRAQVLALERGLPPAGIKVGMAGSAENLAEIGRLLAGRKDVPRVVDPIFRSSSGRRLCGTASARAFLDAVRGNAEVLTPNLAEAARLAGRPVRSVADMRRAAEAIYRRTEVPCLVKGGHLAGDPVNLLYDGTRTFLFGHERVRRDVHGTGCLFSAALLAFLVRKGDLAAAAEAATLWTGRAIRKIPPGRGRTSFFPPSLPRA